MRVVLSLPCPFAQPLSHDCRAGTGPSLGPLLPYSPLQPSPPTIPSKSTRESRSAGRQGRCCAIHYTIRAACPMINSRPLRSVLVPANSSPYRHPRPTNEWSFSDGFSRSLRAARLPSFDSFRLGQLIPPFENQSGSHTMTPARPALRNSSQLTGSPDKNAKRPKGELEQGIASLFFGHLAATMPSSAADHL